MLLRIIWLPVGRRASGFVLVAKWLSKMPELRSEHLRRQGTKHVVSPL
jgi:hypothetical protein